MLRFLVLASLYAAVACAARAADADALARLSDAERKQVNEWMAARAESLIEAHKLNDEIGRAWLDQANTSPEIEKLRARYAELQAAVIQTQREIAAKVQELPAVAEKVKQLDELRRRGQELQKKIKEKVGE